MSKEIVFDNGVILSVASVMGNGGLIAPTNQNTNEIEGGGDYYDGKISRRFTHADFICSPIGSLWIKLHFTD